MVYTGNGVYNGGMKKPPNDGLNYVFKDGQWQAIGEFDKWEISTNFENVVNDPENFIKIAREKVTGLTIIQYYLVINISGINETFPILSGIHCPISKPNLLAGTPFTVVGAAPHLRNSQDYNGYVNVGAKRIFIDNDDVSMLNRTILGGGVYLTDLNPDYTPTP